MNLRQLRYFIAVAEELNFGAAARRLHVAQPALSRQVRSLEEEIGGALLERDRRHVALTTLGMTFLLEARATVQRAGQALQVGQRAARGEVGKVTVGFSSASIFHPLLADAVHVFRSRWPAIALSLDEVGMAQHFDAVRNGDVDLSFVHLDPGDLLPRQAMERAALRIHTVAEEPLMLAIGSHHALALAAGVALADLSELEFLALPSQLTLAAHGPFARMSALRGAPVRIVQEVHSVTAMVHLAGAGLGAAIIPASMACIHTSRIRYVPIEGERRLLLLLEPMQSTPVAANFVDTVRVLGNAAVAAVRSG